MSYSTYGGPIRQSTAITVAFGPMLDATDGFTAETALTITQPDIRLSKNGAAFAQKNAAQTLSHMENGFYSLALDATDTNTVGTLIVHCAESGARPHTLHFEVLEEEIYDGLYASTAGSSTWLPSNVEAILGTAAVSTGTAGTLDVNVAQVNAVTSIAQILRRWLGATGVGLLTADSGTTTTLVDAALTGGTGSYLGGIVHVYGGTNAGMSFRIVGFNAGTDTLTLYPTAPSAFDNTSLYVIVPDAIGTDVWGWLNTQAATPTVAGVPEVDLTHISGSAVSATTAQLGVNVVNLNNNLLSVQRLQAFWSACFSGTSDSGTTTTMVDAARTEADSDYFKGSWIHFTSGTISGQTRRITSFDPATDTITFSPATTQAVSTQTYQIIPSAYVDVAAWLGVTVTGDGDWSELQTDVDAILADTGTDGVVVASLANNSVTAAALAADAVTEIQSGLATAAALTTVDTVVDAIQAKTDNLPSDPADASVIAGRFDTVDAAIAGLNDAPDVSSDVTAIKAKTDQLTFTQANVVDAHIQYVAGEQVTGSGTEADPWGPV
jgi:hypothetical protein